MSLLLCGFSMWQIQVLLLGTFWHIFVSNNFDLPLVESVDIKPTDMEGQR